MIELRNSLEPDIATAEQCFPSVLLALEEYAKEVDTAGDEDGKKYQVLEKYLHGLTGKDMAKFNLYEWWEEEGAEVLAFRISLPDPVHVSDITFDEVSEVVRRIKEYDFSNALSGTFAADFQLFLDNYYHDLLKLNFPETYKVKLFQRNRAKDGSYFEYQIDDIILALMGQLN
ncbi:hypothetical protein [Sphingobacterium thalpophilum]|uniref:hypothetical protein n=1 Tax=Sphingobacterium thalpophilum TaxID=259 RepID=UPI003D96795E